jgi:predicted transcriptional regulator
MLFEKKVTIVKITKPTGSDINKSLQWFGNSLGLFGLRDKDKSCFRVFIELLKASKAREPMSSDEIAAKLELTRGTVVHHVNKLMVSGLVVRQGNKYMLRVDNLSELVEELHRDMSNTCRGLRDVAEEIDRCLGL